MYSIKVEPSNRAKSVIERVMSSNDGLELLPVVIELCKSKYNMIFPVVLYMGNGIYRIFDIHNPAVYAEVSIDKESN
ncbi:hypothetical protein ES705_16278 [subsurface metagenome]